MTRKQLMQQLVKEEAKNLKKNATKEELNKLDFDYLSPESRSSCIYGQMTDSCFSSRAAQLIFKCTKRVYKNDSTLENNLKDAPVNGIPTKERTQTGENTSYWSPIEVFISQDVNINNGNNLALIKYLRGETKTLNFK